MGNAYGAEHTVMFDHLHRRSADSEGIETYSPKVLAVHEEFTRIEESLHAKVAIVYGEKVQKRILNNQHRQFVALPLWDWLDGIVLIAESESGFDNQVQGEVFRRVLLFARHPQRLFYEKEGSSILIDQDRITKAAVLMSNESITYQENYYRQRRWPTRIPSKIRDLIADHELQRSSDLLDTEKGVEVSSLEADVDGEAGDLQKKKEFGA